MIDPRHHTAFGTDGFGRRAEQFTRFLGSGRYLAAQSIFVFVWITLNMTAVALRWDPYPFILLNLCFSTQAAYAAPLILLAQTRQADRDKARMEAEQEHREQLAQQQMAMLVAILLAVQSGSPPAPAPHASDA